MTALPLGTIVCSAKSLAPDAVSLEALARLQLAARRCGQQIHLRDVPGELAELIALCGLREALGVEVQGQVEEGEERLGIEEERQLDDPAR
jgi:hypothetical protein